MIINGCGNSGYIYRKLVSMQNAKVITDKVIKKKVESVWHNSPYPLLSSAIERYVCNTRRNAIYVMRSFNIFLVTTYGKKKVCSIWQYE